MIQTLKITCKNCKSRLVLINKKFLVCAKCKKSGMSVLRDAIAEMLHEAKNPVAYKVLIDDFIYKGKP